MEKIRCLVASSENGEKERVVFTEDFETPGTDFFSMDFTVDSDTQIDNVLPSGFPVDYALARI